MQAASGTPITGAAGPRTAEQDAAADGWPSPRPRVVHGATSTSPARTGYRILISAVAVAMLGLDQWTKHLAETNLVIGQPVPVIGDLLSLQLHYNPGAAFSMGTQFTVVLSVLALVVFAGAITLLAPRIRGWLPAWATGLLIAGVGGNLIDRLFRDPGPFLGHVVDFLALRYFAIFNVADMCITAAAALFIIWSFRSERG